MDEKDILVTEWKEIRESLRYFGNKRFAQLTVFIAATGGLLTAFFQPAGFELHGILPFVGFFLSLAFFFMEYSSASYCEKFVRRAVIIEKTEGIPLRLMTKFRPKGKCGTHATYFIYIAVCVVWFGASVQQISTFTQKPVCVPMYITHNNYMINPTSQPDTPKEIGHCHRPLHSAPALDKYLCGEDHE